MNRDSGREPIELPKPKEFGFPRLYPNSQKDEKWERERREFAEQFEEWLDRVGFSPDIREALIQVHEDDRNWDAALSEQHRMERAARGETESPKIEFLKLMETTIINCRRRYRFLDCGDGRVNGFRYRMKDGPVIWRTENDPEHVELLKELSEFGAFTGRTAFSGHDIFPCRRAKECCALDDGSDIGSVAAEFVIRFLENDFEFFEEIGRMLAIRGGKRGGKRGVPMSARLIAAAFEMKYRLDRNPTREELKEEAKRLGIKVGDWKKTLKDCKLSFLKGRRGRRPKMGG